MIAKLKKTSTKVGKPAPKKAAPVKASAEKSTAKAAPKEHKSALHRMLTAEGWKRMMMKKD